MKTRDTVFRIWIDADLYRPFFSCWCKDARFSNSQHHKPAWNHTMLKPVSAAARCWLHSSGQFTGSDNSGLVSATLLCWGIESKMTCNMTWKLYVGFPFQRFGVIKTKSWVTGCVVRLITVAEATQNPADVYPERIAKLHACWQPGLAL